MADLWKLEIEVFDQYGSLVLTLHSNASHRYVHDNWLVGLRSYSFGEWIKFVLTQSALWTYTEVSLVFDIKDRIYLGDSVIQGGREWVRNITNKVVKIKLIEPLIFVDLLLSLGEIDG